MDDYNASDTRAIRSAAKAAKLAERQRREAVGRIMGDPAGRDWMWSILNRCHIFSSSHTGDALNTAFSEGERNIGLQFLNDVMANCPDEFIQMMREANDRHIAADRRPSGNRADFGRTDSGQPDDDYVARDYDIEGVGPDTIDRGEDE